MRLDLWFLYGKFTATIGQREVESLQVGEELVVNDGGKAATSSHVFFLIFASCYGL